MIGARYAPGWEAPSFRVPAFALLLRDPAAGVTSKPAPIWWAGKRGTPISCLGLLPRPFRDGTGTAASWNASPLVGINLFPQFRTKAPERIALPATEPPGLPPEEEEAKPANMVIPIQVSDVDYALLMRALCPAGTPVSEDLPADVPAPNAPSAVDGAGQTPLGNLRIVSPDRPPGTPIV